MNWISLVQTSALVLTIPVMFALLLATRRFWPSVLFGMSSVSVVAYFENRADMIPLLMAGAVLWCAFELYQRRRYAGA